ncbi:type IV pili methyl-accepting chemotaxis transducer N-terminal domain-containing protein [Hydrogenophaga atypica]|uniref:Type IV pili methyl-accepting chemotaxis transducer N-terminal domain-containing protein n=1 Tax=Hydrogenophaga atypica TaxID=249409 RepID=A0ABW2QGL8_9BURK
MTHLPATNDISLVNLAARQRMLSQRLALQILLAAQGRDGMEQAAQATLKLFADSQAQLLGTVSRLPATDAAALQAVYQGPGGVQRLIDSFITQAKDALAPGPLQARALAWLVDHIDEVLTALNTATTAFDQISTRKEASLMKELRGIVGDIQSVAREAKVVSFNAQVIAARAGSVGREFAVVASTLSTISTEVDTLARKGMALATR